MKRIPELDGLRGIAILGVLMFHLFPPTVPLFAAYFVQAGWLGVDLFFVLSGYLITGILVDSAGKPGYYRNFVVRRTLRIFPLYFVCLAMATVVDFWPGPFNWKRFVDSGYWWYACFLGNVPVFREVKWPGGALTPYWSLQIEEQFYLTYPLLVWVLSRRTLGRALGVLIAVAFLIRVAFVVWMPANITSTYVLMPSRMDALALGGLVAVLQRENPAVLRGRWIEWVTVGAAAVTGWICWKYLPGPWSTPMRTIGFTAADVAFCGMLILIIAQQNPLLGAICRVRPLVWLGTVSYGVYLLHAGVSETIRRWMVSEGWHRGTWLETLLCVTGSLALAAVSWKWFESPILRLRSRLC